MDPVEGNLQKYGKHCTVRRILQFENNISTLKWLKHIEVIEHRSLKINPRRCGFNISPPLKSGFPRPLNPPSREIFRNAIRRRVWIFSGITHWGESSTSTLYLLHISLGYLTFSYYFIFDRIVCSGELSLCDAHNKEFASC